MIQMTNNDIKSAKSVKKKKHKEPDKIENHLMQELVVPSEEVWLEEFKQFDFTKEQRRELEVVLINLREDIYQFNKKTKEIGLRTENKRRLIALEKALAKTRYLLEHYQDGMDNWLPFDMREEIGLLSNFLIAQEALGEKTYSDRLNREIVDAAYQNSPLTIEKVEEKLVPSRKSIGLLAGHKILLNFVQRIHEPLIKWREMERENKGGSPAQKTQRAIIYWLAWSAPEIIGRKAAIRKTGRFVELCSAVLSACGLPNPSVGDSAPKIVKKALKDKKDHIGWLGGRS
jgi:hypothetical protein